MSRCARPKNWAPKAEEVRIVRFLHYFSCMPGLGESYEIVRLPPHSLTS